MAFFELKSNNCDGHIRTLSRAIMVASRVTQNAILEFTPERMRLCARTELLLIKFIFAKGFFTHYKCDQRRRCFVNLKALLMPFKSSILLSDRDLTLRSSIGIKCSVEDELNNQIVFKISADPQATTLTYRLCINDLDPDSMLELNAINRTIEYARVELSPKQSKSERFLLSAFNNFAPDIDQVTIKASPSEVKFIGTTSPLYNRSATSEFKHTRDDFEKFEVKEDISITVPLRFLKLFLSFVETSKVQTYPRYVFEGVGQPAHFMYDAQLFKAHCVSSTPMEFIPEAIELPRCLNESFIAEEDIMQADEDIEPNDDDGYNDNESDDEEAFLDGNLDGLNESTGNHSFSVTGYESIRSEMRMINPDPEKVRDILYLDQDPDEIENVEVRYSSDSSSSD